MTDLERLLAIEEIRQLKGRYWLGVDLKDEALLRGVFTDDAAILLREESYTKDTPGPGGPTPAAFAQRCLSALAPFTTAHHGHNLQIRFTSDTEAEGIWPMEDNLWAKDPATARYAHLQGFGLYHDTYRKTADGWRISSTTLQRLNVTRR